MDSFQCLPRTRIPLLPSFSGIDSWRHVSERPKSMPTTSTTQLKKEDVALALQPSAMVLNSFCSCGHLIPYFQRLTWTAFAAQITQMKLWRTWILSVLNYLVLAMQNKYSAEHIGKILKHWFHSGYKVFSMDRCCAAVHDFLSAPWKRKNLDTHLFL